MKPLSLLRRYLVPPLIAAGIVALLILGFRPSPVLVDTEPVSRGYLEITVEDEGRTRVADRFVVSAPVLAESRRIRLDVGDAVRVGDVLVTLDATSPPALDLRSVHQARARVAAAESALSAAREELTAAQANARYARDEHSRLERLAERDLAAPTLVERAAAEARHTAAMERSAAFRVESARHELELAAAALAYAGGQDPQASGVIELRAPVDGRVLRRHFESARVVQAGEAILEIGDPTQLEVEVDVLSSDAVRIAPGMRVWLERWGETEPLEGRVRHVEPTGFTKISALGVEEQRVWVIVDLVSPREHWVRLGDGYRVNARFVLWEDEDVLRVATSALFRHDGGWAVFVVSNGRAQLRRVEIGRRGALMTQVLSGLEAGEQVVVHPDRDLADGVRITLREP